MDPNSCEGQGTRHSLKFSNMCAFQGNQYPPSSDDCVCVHCPQGLVRGHCTVVGVVFLLQYFGTPMTHSLHTTHALHTQSHESIHHHTKPPPYTTTPSLPRAAHPASAAYITVNHQTPKCASAIVSQHCIQSYSTSTAPAHSLKPPPCCVHRHAPPYTTLHHHTPPYTSLHQCSFCMKVMTLGERTISR